MRTRTHVSTHVGTRDDRDESDIASALLGARMLARLIRDAVGYPRARAPSSSDRSDANNTHMSAQSGRVLGACALCDQLTARRDRRHGAPEQRAVKKLDVAACELANAHTCK
jgi:hypothetical protein